MDFVSMFDKKSIALLATAILVALDYLCDSSIIITYDSYKCYVYELDDLSTLLIGLLLNLIIFSVYGLFVLCLKIYLSIFLITYVLSAVYTGSLDLAFGVIVLLCLYILEDYIIPSEFVKCLIVFTSFILLGQIYCNFLNQTQWRLISYRQLDSISKKILNNVTAVRSE